MTRKKPTLDQRMQFGFVALLILGIVCALIILAKLTSRWDVYCRRLSILSWKHTQQLLRAPLPKEGYVRQQVVALRELIEMLDPAALAPVQEISQPFGVRLHGLGVFEKGFLARELPYLIRHTLAIGIAILLDRYATAHSVERSLPALHGFDRCFEIHANGFVLHP